MQSTIQAQKEHCIFCFDILLSTLNKQPLPKFPNGQEVFEAPLFITFHLNLEELRGCIGTFQAGPIDKQLQRFTIQSAFKDTRFGPIQHKELDELDVSVSLLVKFEKDKKWDQWSVGVHGIIIDFSDDKGSGNRKYGATFLPEVAAEQEWDKETTIKNLIKKAGYNRNHQNMLERIKLTTYESSKFRMTYQEYKQIKVR